MEPVVVEVSVQILDCSLCPKGKTDFSFSSQPAGVLKVLRKDYREVARDEGHLVLKRR